MRNVLIILLMIIGIMLSSCSDSLTREKAAEMIIEGLNYPQEEKCSFKNTYLEKSSKHKVSQLTWNTYKNDMYFLEEQGLITIETQEKSWVDGWGYSQIKVTKHILLTDTGKTYLRDSYNDNLVMKCREFAFGEVTGLIVHEEQNYAEIKYTVIRTNHNPFHFVSNNQPSEDTLNRSASFVKYDDGWRLASD